MEPVPKSFFLKESTQIAEGLLGCYLVRRFQGKELIGKIVETEAYLGLKDSCCHSFKGIYTKRTQTMYLPGGYSYVYFTYGMHYCFNVVTGDERDPSAVLIRALEPVQGLSEMKKNRKKDKPIDLCSGPGKLCQAFQITTALNAKNLSQKKEIYIAGGKQNQDVELDSRVGVPLHKDSAYFFLRFYIKYCPFVSVRKNQIS